MGLINNLKRMYQWRCEHYFEALLANDMNKRRAILNEFMKTLYKNGVPECLINGRDQEFEKHIIRQGTKSPTATIYEVAKLLAEELKAPS